MRVASEMVPGRSTEGERGVSKSDIDSFFNWMYLLSVYFQGKIIATYKLVFITKKVPTQKS